MTAEELATAVGTVQDAIAAVLQTAIPLSVVHNRWVMDRNTDSWGALLESENDLDDAEAPRIHGITVALAGVQIQPGERQPLNAIALQVTFAIDFFVGYVSGDSTDNSEVTLRHDTIVSIATLYKFSDLGVRPLVKGHNQLQMPPTFDVVPLGSRLAHQASGTLTVLMQSQDVS